MNIQPTNKALNYDVRTVTSAEGGANDALNYDNATALAAGEGSQKPNFNYQGIPEEDRDEILQIVGEIKNTWGIQEKAEFKAVVEVGRRLLRAKKKLPHGEWQWTQKTAENYTNLALNSAKIETVTNLDLGAAYVLFAKSTPANIQEELLARVKSGEHISRKDVKERIAAAKTTGRKPTAKPKRAEPMTLTLKLKGARKRIADLDRFLREAKKDFIAFRDPLPPEDKARAAKLAAELAFAYDAAKEDELKALARQYHWRVRDLAGESCSALQVSGPGMTGVDESTSDEGSAS